MQDWPDAANDATLAAFGVKDLPDQRGVRSVPFEPFLELAEHALGSEVDPLTNQVRAAWLEGRERVPGLSKQQQFENCVRLILVNLMRAQTISDGLTVGIASGKQRLDAERRYHPEFMSVSYFRAALDTLRRVGLMHVVSSGFQIDGLAQVARYALTEDARKCLVEGKPSLSSFVMVEPRETVQLRNAEGQLVNYRDTPRTVAMRDALARINAVLSDAEIGSVRPPDPLQDFDDDFAGAGTHLYRVFNNRSFDQGGRFYGGWWQWAKREFRPLITINGQPTVEADFKGLHPSILFAKNGLPIPDDPYALIPGVAGNSELRDHAKKTFNALVNAPGNTREPRNFDSAKYGITAAGLRQSIENAFPMLPGIFGTGVGMLLQREDSDLAEKIMLHFVEKGIPILPIHDSFIVEAQHQNELVATMCNTFQAEYGCSIRVTIK